MVPFSTYLNIYMNTSVEALKLVHTPLFTGREACSNGMQGMRKG
jgi:hypothetical protein